MDAEVFCEVVLFGNVELPLDTGKGLNRLGVTFTQVERPCPYEWKSRHSRRLALFPAGPAFSHLPRLISQVHAPAALVADIPAPALETAALKAGFRGIVAARSPAGTQVRAIQQMLAGDLWFRRRVLHQALSDMRNTPGRGGARAEPPEGPECDLTRRELHILWLLSTGATTKSIARTLAISPSTVKSHLYQAYRKTHSRNRIEAINWFNSHRSAVS